jgi:hypothetical protein
MLYPNLHHGNILPVANCNPLQPYVHMYGSPIDMDLTPANLLLALRSVVEPSPSPSRTATAASGRTDTGHGTGTRRKKSRVQVPSFHEPILIWNPTEQQIENTPADSPIFFAGHTTDDEFVMRANEAFDPTDYFDYMPLPPLHDGYKRGNKEVFLWGHPEPFVFINHTTPDQEWVLAKTKLEALYPYRNKRYVFACTCYGVQFVNTDWFPNIHGLYDTTLLVRDDDKAVCSGFVRLYA